MIKPKVFNIGAIIVLASIPLLSYGKNNVWTVKVTNLNTKEEHTFKPGEEDFKIPVSFGWACYLRKMNIWKSGKAMICSRNDETFAAHVGCGPNEENGASLQLFAESGRAKEERVNVLSLRVGCDVILE